MWYLLKKRN